MLKKIHPRKENRPIKVLHIIQAKHFGGAEQVVYTLVKSFHRKEISPSVLTLSSGLLSQKLDNSGIENFMIPMRSKKDIFMPVLKAIMLIRKHHFDIVHTHTVRSNLIGRMAAFFTGKKCITHLHSPVRRDFADLKRGKRNEFIDALTRWIADRYIAVSQSLKDEMVKKGLSSSKITAIHNAIDIESRDFSDFNNNEEDGIRKEFNIPRDAFLMVIVALLRPRKGVEVALKAMPSILQHHTNVNLLIVGSDDISENPGYGDKLKTLSKKLNIETNVVFSGFRDDIPAILNQCNLMLLPSLFGEGLPMVILEAMTMNVPVIASNIEGVPEVIEDSVNGFLFDSGDWMQLTQKIIEVLKAPALLENIKKHAKEKILNELNGVSQAKKIEVVYKEILV